jgi:hypothetical protein
VKTLIDYQKSTKRDDFVSEFIMHLRPLLPAAPLNANYALLAASSRSTTTQRDLPQCQSRGLTASHSNCYSCRCLEAEASGLDRQVSDCQQHRTASSRRAIYSCSCCTCTCYLR